MFKSNAYGILRTFNKVLIDKQIIEMFGTRQTKMWLRDFYQTYNHSRRNHELPYDPTDIIDFSFAERLTVYKMAWREWQQFNSRLIDLNYRLHLFNKGKTSHISGSVAAFRHFLDCFLDYVSERETELFDLICCEDCEELVHEDYSTSVYGGDRIICEDCRDSEYYYHNGSDQYVHNEDEEYSDCEDGDEDNDCDFQGVLRYDVDVMDYLSKKKLDNEPRITRKTLLGGLECEWEARSSCPTDLPEQIDELFGGEYCKFKSDGSLRNGFEMVTAPCTLAYHRQQIDKLFDWNGWTDEDKNTYVKAWNTDTCGIHVHLNRGSFTGSQIGKILQIVNEDMNRNFIEAVAGRKANDYAKFSKKSIAEGGQRDYSKYEAVNTAHSQSIELRIFRGNATKNGILRVLEFSFALGEYVQQCSFKALHYRDFLKWFNLPRNRADYPFINEWFVRKGYLKDGKSNRLVTNEINEAIDNAVNG